MSNLTPNLVESLTRINQIRCDIIECGLEDLNKLSTALNVAAGLTRAIMIGEKFMATENE